MQVLSPNAHSNLCVGGEVGTDVTGQGRDVLLEMSLHTTLAIGDCPNVQSYLSSGEGDGHNQTGWDRNVFAEVAFMPEKFFSEPVSALFQRDIAQQCSSISWPFRLIVEFPTTSETHTRATRVSSNDEVDVQRCSLLFCLKLRVEVVRMTVLQNEYRGVGWQKINWDSFVCVSVNLYLNERELGEIDVQVVKFDVSAGLIHLGTFVFVVQSWNSFLQQAFVLEHVW